MRGELRRQKQQASGHTRGGGGRYPGKKCPAMKQGTEPVPEEDVQRCYDEMRKEFVFGEPLRQVKCVFILVELADQKWWWGESVRACANTCLFPIEASESFLNAEEQCVPSRASGRQKNQTHSSRLTPGECCSLL